MRISVRLMGVFRTSAGAEKIQLTLEQPLTVRQLVEALVKQIGRSEFERYLIDPELRDPRPNTLILVSGKEIGTLDGLATQLRDDDEVTLLPVSHGG